MRAGEDLDDAGRPSGAGARAALRVPDIVGPEAEAAVQRYLRDHAAAARPARAPTREGGAVAYLSPVFAAAEPPLPPEDFQPNGRDHRVDAARLAGAGWRCITCGTDTTERFYRRPGRTRGYRCHRCYDAWIRYKRSAPGGNAARPARRGGEAPAAPRRADELAVAQALEHMREAAALARRGHRCRTCGTGETTRFHGGRGAAREYWCAACHGRRMRERHEFAANWSRRHKDA